jgi:hypothetical protein
MKRAFDRKGHLRKDVQSVLKAEKRRIRKFFAKHSDICPRDLTLLLMSEVQLAGALANISRQQTRGE